MKKLFLLTFLLGTIFIAWCEKWKRTAFFYLDKDNLWDETTWIISEPLNSYKECLKRLTDTRNKKYAPNFDSECGLNCEKAQWFYGTYYDCDETKGWI